MKTVKELYNELGKLIEQGHGDARVIANCEFAIDGEYYGDFYLSELNDVSYKSGNIELFFQELAE